MADTYAYVEGVSKAIKVTTMANALAGDTTVNLPTNLTTTMVKIVGTIERDDAHFDGSTYLESTGTTAITVIVPVTRIKHIQDL
jgi:hypothetical protein